MTRAFQLWNSYALITDHHETDTLILGLEHLGRVADASSSARCSGVVEQPPPAPTHRQGEGKGDRLG